MKAKKVFASFMFSALAYIRMILAIGSLVAIAQRFYIVFAVWLVAFWMSSELIGWVLDFQERATHEGVVGDKAKVGDLVIYFDGFANGKVSRIVSIDRGRVVVKIESDGAYRLVRLSQIVIMKTEFVNGD